MSNFDYVEIKDNVNVGDVIITSDMSEYKNEKEITITIEYASKIFYIIIFRAILKCIVPVTK